MNNSIYKKMWFRVVVVFFVMFGILYWFGFVNLWFINVKSYFQDKSAKQYFQEQENKSAELEQLYKEDVYGGATPEETWKLFVEALEKGDVDLASKYFVIEKQEEMRVALDAGKKNNAIDSFLKIIEEIDSGDYYQNDNTKFRYVVIGTEGKWNGIVQFTYDLVLNKETNKWKILDL